MFLMCCTSGDYAILKLFTPFRFWTPEEVQKIKKGRNLKHLFIKMFKLTVVSEKVSNKIKITLYCFLGKANSVLQTLLQRAKWFLIIHDTILQFCLFRENTQNPNSWPYSASHQWLHSQIIALSRKAPQRMLFKCCPYLHYI